MKVLKSRYYRKQIERELEFIWQMRYLYLLFGFVIFLSYLNGR